MFPIRKVQPSRNDVIRRDSAPSFFSPFFLINRPSTLQVSGTMHAASLAHGCNEDPEASVWSRRQVSELCPRLCIFPRHEYRERG